MLIYIICQIAEKAVRSNDVNWELYWWACNWHNARMGYVHNSLTLKLLLQEQEHGHDTHPVPVPDASTEGGRLPHT